MSAHIEWTTADRPLELAKPGDVSDGHGSTNNKHALVGGGFAIEGTPAELADLLRKTLVTVLAQVGDGANANVLPPFFTVSQRVGTEGAEYVLQVDNGRFCSVYDGDDDYWTLANLIDRQFPTGR